MGVKDLWSVLSPTCEKKSLWELQGLTIAIDLSSWIVDSQNIGDNSVMNMYLRNLFFRTSYLLLLGVKPIFIMDGKAPALKHDTIARRNQASKDCQIVSKNKNGNRGRLNCLQKKCEDLLLSMGVKCYKSEGEAEALCSRLNEVGIVDAVISQDSDCFLYGAKVVLRNFTMSPAYTCDMYTMKNIEEKLSLGRQKLLALSLICGCDYESGVHGVGKQSALKFLATVPDEQVLDRLRSWRRDDFADNLSQSVEDKLEWNIRKKAILDPSFPSEEVISEFMTAKSKDLPNFVWLKPSLPSFVGLADRLLAWEDDYISSKFMPLVTRWHLLHEGASCGLRLEAIVKKRSVRGVASYELRWNHDGMGELTTVEPIELVAKVYSELHDAYLKSKEKPKKAGKGRKKKTQPCEDAAVDDVENLLGKLDISGQKVKQPNKKRGKNKTINGLQTLDRFLLKDKPLITNNQENKTTNVILHSTPIGTPTRKPDLTKSYHYLSDDSNDSSPLRKNNKDKNPCEQEDMELPTLDFISFDDSRLESCELDLSNIVNSIVGRTSNNPAIKIWADKMN